MKLATRQEINQLISVYRSNDLPRAQALAVHLASQYPDDAMVFNILIVVGIRNENLTLARQAGERAVKLNADYRDAVFNLANVYLLQRDFYAAKSLMNAWLARYEDDQQGFSVLLEVANELSEKYDALFYCERLLHCDSKDEKLAVLKAQLLQGLGRFEDALTWIESFSREHNCSDRLTLTKANILSDLGCVSEAESIYEAMRLTRNSNDHVFLLDSANFYLEQGNFSNAQDNLELVLSEAPTEAQAWVTLSKLPLENSKLHEIESRITALLDSRTLTENSTAHIQFALGNLAHKQKNYEKAFQAFSEGNAIRAKHTPFNFENEKLFFDKIQSLFRALDQEQIAPIGPNTTPIFVVGLPRSGTTLLEQILSTHSDVVALGEVEILKSELYQWIRSIQFDQAPIAGALRAIVNDYLELMSHRAAGSRFFVDKLPLNFLWIGFIAKLVPNAKFIHTFKSPLPACWSLYKQEFKGYTCSYGFKSLAQYYTLYSNHMSFWRSRVNANQLIEVRYEDFVEDPASYIRNILMFCNLSEESQVVNFEGSQQTVRTLSATQVRTGVSAEFKSEIDLYKPFLHPLIESLVREGIEL